MQGKRLLITGVTGQLAFPIARALAKDNDVWGAARFSDPVSMAGPFSPATRQAVEGAGVTTRVLDLTDPDWSQLPDHFDHVLHFAIYQQPGSDFDHAIRVNAEATGELMYRFRSAASFLIPSTTGVYAEPDDPGRWLKETDPLGDQCRVWAATYSISKIAQEAVARTMARTLGLPTTIARMGRSYRDADGTPAAYLDMMLAGQPIPLLRGRTASNPIYESDIVEQASALLEAATSPATIVNWAGDDVVTVEEYLTYLGELVGVQPRFDYVSGVLGSTIADPELRQSLIGHCKVSWRDGMRRMLAARRPELADASVGADASSGRAGSKGEREWD